MSVRIYELSREFDIPNKEVVEICREAGLDVSSHSSTIDEDEAAMVRRRLAAFLDDDTDEPEPEPAAPAVAVAEPPTPAVPQLTPDEQLIQARQRVISLPTRGLAKPKAEGVKLPGRRKPPARRLEAEAAVAEAEVPAAAPAAAPPEAAPEPAKAAAVEEQAPAAAAPAAAPAEAAAAPPAEAAEAAQAEAAPAEVEAPEVPAERRERRILRRPPPGPKLAPKPKLAPRPKLASKPPAHPQKVTEAPPEHPQAVGVGVPKKKQPSARPSKPRARPVIPGEPVPAETTAEAPAAARRGRRRGVKKAADEEAEGLRRAQAFRRRERIRKREELDDLAGLGEGGAGAGGLVSERVRIGRTGRPVAARPTRRAGRAPAPGEPRKAVVVEVPISVKNLSAAIGVKASDIIKHLMVQGVMATINDVLTAEQALDVALSRDIELTVRHERGRADVFQEIEQRQDAPETLVLRSPIVTFLGHVDHGKTSLMDYIRKSRVVDGEAGGITQHIGAYRVHVGDRWVTFLDTPGHEAFTAMRSRGAKVTDVVVLVIAADDGVMPQTEEAINHAKAAGVPIVVAINKCDLPQARPERVKQQLTQYELLTEEWGGKTICVETSAVTGQNVDRLLESLLLEAEMIELKARPDRPAIGTVIEAQLAEGFGPMATLLVQDGTLEAGNVVVAGTAYGKVRAMTDETGKRMHKAGPAIPVRVAGLSGVPEAGDRFYVLADFALAKQLAEDRQRQDRETELAELRRPRTLEAVFDQMTRAQVKELAVILKADVQGSVEAIRENLAKIEHPEVRVRVIHAGVGGINESDVLLADASDAIIVGFNAVPDLAARMLAEDRDVSIRQYNIIYNITDDVRKALEGLLTPQEEERHLGECEVLQTFKVSRVGTIAGCRMTDGVIHRSAKLRIIRDGVVVYSGRIGSLKRFKDDVREARSGQECGIHIAGYDDVKVGDRLEAFDVVSVARTL